MRMKSFLHKYLPYITPQQAKGLFGLLFLLVFSQIIWWYFDSKVNQTVDNGFDEKQTLLIQKKIDSIQNLVKEEKEKIQPFNPNFITDYRGSLLEMSVQEIDRLHAFRATGKYVNSIKEFQQVTKVSDQWIEKYSLYFKFPDWVTNKNQADKSSYQNYSSENKVAVSTTDINKASFEDFKAIRGIGDVLAQRIIDERTQLGGFVSMKQIDFIRNLSPEAAREVKKVFKVSSKSINRINVNQSSIEQLARVPYINSHIARQIVILRSKQSEPLQLEDLKKINNFPIEKIEIIALYLDF